MAKTKTETTYALYTPNCVPGVPIRRFKSKTKADTEADRLRNRPKSPLTIEIKKEVQTYEEADLPELKKLLRF